MTVFRRVLVCLRDGHSHSGVRARARRAAGRAELLRRELGGWLGWRTRPGPEHHRSRAFGLRGRRIAGRSRRRDRGEPDLGPARSESDGLAAHQHVVVGDPPAVDEGAVGAAQVPEHVEIADEGDRRVPARDIEVLIGVELQLRLGMAPDADVGLGEDVGLACARAGKEGELGSHAWWRAPGQPWPNSMKRPRATASSVMSPTSSQRGWGCGFGRGTGAGLPV